jgi:hypothetical protein
MSTNPLREENVQAGVEALRATRDNLARSLAVMRAELASHHKWSWPRFSLGLLTPLLAAAVCVAWYLARASQ